MYYEERLILLAFIPKVLLFLVLLPFTSWGAETEFMALQACLLKEEVNLHSFEVNDHIATASLTPSKSNGSLNNLSIRSCLQEVLPSDQNALILDRKLYLKLSSSGEKFFVRIKRARQTKGGQLEAAGTCSPSSTKIQILTNLGRYSTPCVSGKWYFLGPKKEEKFKYILLAYRNYIKKVVHDFRHLD